MKNIDKIIKTNEAFATIAELQKEVGKVSAAEMICRDILIQDDMSDAEKELMESKIEKTKLHEWNAYFRSFISSLANKHDIMDAMEQISLMERKVFEITQIQVSIIETILTSQEADDAEITNLKEAREQGREAYWNAYFTSFVAGLMVTNEQINNAILARLIEEKTSNLKK